MADPPRPYPHRGVFETMLAVDGRPVELDAHLARLAASLDALFGPKSTPDARALALDRARGIHLGRLRLSVAPGPDGRLRAEAAAVEIGAELVFPSREGAAALGSLTVPGGLGAHKWADRALLERAEEELPAGTVPLLLDRDGTVLEVSRGNVFLVRDGALATAAADGRILPGIARRRTIETARAAGLRVHERDLSLAALIEADEVFLTGSVRGVEPVRSVDGVDLVPVGEVASTIAAVLRRRWLRQPLH